MTEAIFPRATLFQAGQFVLRSGATSAFKIECDALTDADWDGLAVMAAPFMPRIISEIIAIPEGGVPFAAALVRSGDFHWGSTAHRLFVEMPPTHRR